MYRSVTARPTYFWLCAVIVFFCLPLLQGQVVTHPYSVRDAIARTTFSDPDETSGDAFCRPSPDGKRFLIVTTRALLNTNQVESSLWIYDATSVRAHVAVAKPLAPIRLWFVKGIPRLEQSHSYGALITKAAWASDSASVLFLLEQPDRKRHLYTLAVGDRHLHPVSSAGQDIADYAEANGTVAYVVVRASPSQQRYKPSSFNLTGQSMFHILDPAQFPEAQSLYRSSDLWIRFHGRNVCMSRESGGHAWTYPVAAKALLHLSIAPDGNRLIAARPVEHIESTWRRFKTYVSRFDLTNLQMPNGDPGLDWDWPWEYVCFDLQTRRAWPMAHAPSSVTAGYGGTASATWSKDSKAVVFTNTFLTEDQPEENAEHLAACAAAVSFIDQRKTSCVAFSPYPAKRVAVQMESFGATNREVVLTWSDGSIERYNYQDRCWDGPFSAAVSSKPRGTVRVEMRQGLNTAPALWGVDTSSGSAKELWNPNTQGKSLLWGHVSAYEWTGTDGYRWHAGLVLPPTYTPGQRYPLVIQTHGFQRERYLVDGPYATAFAAQALAAKDIVVLQLEDRSDRHRVPADQEAILTAKGYFEAVQRLSEDGLIDPDRVGIIGFSRTSWYVETALELFPAAFRAAIIADGVDQGYMSYMLFCPTLDSCKTDVEDADDGRPFGTGLKSWLTHAVSLNTDKIQTPVRIEAIQLYSLLQEWELYSCLNQQHKMVDLAYIPNGQHILQQPRQRYASQQGTVDWMRFWLQGYQDPGPRKEAQYIRWEHLRELNKPVSP